ncbi:MAG: hypothetical protein KBB09_01730 [Firmicutes bacterium]|nr:hypothetical protein [Bacillota bacterium]
MHRQVLGSAGRAASGCGRAKFAWAALADGAACDGPRILSALGMKIKEALEPLDWSTVGCGAWDAAVQRMDGRPAPVLVDLMLKGAVEEIPKTGLIALAVSARVPGIDLPCGGIMWNVSDPCQDATAQASPMSFTNEGLCIWTEGGAWCAVADCAPSVMAAVASKARQQEPDGVLNFIVREAQRRRIETLLVVADATGVKDGAGGVAYKAGGAEAVLRL